MADSIPAYKILALGPFAPVPEDSFTPRFIELDLYSIDDAVKTMAPALYLPISEKVCPEGALTLKFSQLKDFKPKSMTQNNLFLNSLLSKSRQRPGGDENQDTKKNDIGNTPPEKSAAVDDILSMVAVTDSPPEQADRGTFSREDLHGIMREIFSRKKLIKTETAWRGAQTLVKQANIKGSNKINVRISAVSRSSLEHVLNAVQSLPNDKLPNLVLIDLDFDNTVPALELIEKVIEFADTMMIPTCIEVNPQFFRINDWHRLEKLSYIKNYLDDISYAKFRKLKLFDGASMVMACMNRFAVRNAYEFEKEPLFISPVWGLGTLCAESVHETGWPMAFSKYTQYRLDDLPLYSLDGKNTSGVQALISDEKIIQIAESGITALVGKKNNDTAFIPKETSLAGESIKFQMFFNRVLDTIVTFREQENPGLSPEERIKKAISDLFIHTGHQMPEHISVKKNKETSFDQNQFTISFLPPATVFPDSTMLTFSFLW